MQLWRVKRSSAINVVLGYVHLQPTVIFDAHLVNNATAPMVHPQQVWYKRREENSLDGRVQDESYNTASHLHV